MINTRIYETSGNNALKLDCNINNNQNINHGSKQRKRKWRLKPGAREFYIGSIEFIALLGTIAAIPFITYLFFN